MTLNQSHISKVKVTVPHIRNLCPGKNSLPCWILIVFHTIVVDDSRMCHDLYPRSRSQSTHTRNPYPGHNSLLTNLMGMLLHLVDHHVTGVVVTGGGGGVLSLSR